MRKALAPLRVLARRLDDETLRALFAAIRQADDARLLKELRPPPTAAKPMDFAQEIESRLKALWASAAEKADLLAAEFASEADPKGLKPTIRALVAAHGETSVRDAIDRLLTRLAAYSTHDKVK